MSLSTSNDSVIDFRMRRVETALRNGDIESALKVAERYALEGLLAAQLFLGKQLSSSENEEDKKRAHHWFSAAADQGSVEAYKKLWWMTAIAEGDDSWEKSVPFLVEAADRGDMHASGTIISMYGDSPSDRFPNMLAYLERHVAKGEALAQLRMALAHEWGYYGLEKNIEKAFELYLQSAKQGNVHAQCCVGVCYAAGEGVERNDEQAVYWYRKAALHGSAQAQCNLGYSYEIGRYPLKQSMQEANRWYRRSAMRNFRTAQHNLGQSYFHGRAVPIDYELANKWFMRAAEQGHVAAQCSLGFSYERGRGVEKSYEKAAELYKSAALAGDTQAQQNYGYLLENGLGVTKNLEEAIDWYRTAAEQGLASAQSCLAWMYENGKGVDMNFEEAMRYYALAAAQGDKRGKDGVERLSSKQIAINEVQAILNKGRADLNAFEEKMKIEDPEYQAKKAILVPILKPVIARIDPSQWVATFEEAYKNLPASALSKSESVPNASIKKMEGKKDV